MLSTVLGLQEIRKKQNNTGEQYDEITINK